MKSFPLNVEMNISTIDFVEMNVEMNKKYEHLLSTSSRGLFISGKRISIRLGFNWIVSLFSSYLRCGKFEPNSYVDPATSMWYPALTS
jgi:hypothetical protein